MKKSVWVLVILLVPIVHSLGMGTEYLVDNILSLRPGESYVYSVTLQNADDFDVKAKFQLNSMIAEILDYQETYLIKADSYDTNVRIKITIPETDSPDKTYSIDYSLQPIIEEQGQVTMNFKINKNLIVKVINDEEITSEITKEPGEKDGSKSSNPLLVLGLLILTAIIVSFVVKRSSIIVNKFKKTKLPKFKDTLIPRTLKDSLKKISEHEKLSLKENTKRVKKKEKELRKAEKQQERLEKLLLKKEKELSNREKDIQKMEENIKGKESEIEKTVNHTLDVLEKDQKKEYKEFKKIEDGLLTRKDELDKKEKELSKKELDLLKFKEELTIKEQSLDKTKYLQLEKEDYLTDKEKQIDKNKAKLDKEKKKEVEKAIENIVVKDPKDYFYFCSGEAVASVKELNIILSQMEEDVFNHHVNENRNDFADWVTHVFKDKKLSAKIRSAKSKSALKRLLENEV